MTILNYIFSTASTSHSDRYCHDLVSPASPFWLAILAMICFKYIYLETDIFVVIFEVRGQPRGSIESTLEPLAHSVAIVYDVAF